MPALRQSLQSDELSLMEATDHLPLAKIKAFSHNEGTKRDKEDQFLMYTLEKITFSTKQS